MKRSCLGVLIPTQMMSGFTSPIRRIKSSSSAGTRGDRDPIEGERESCKKNPS
jgi:hypothetical protein